MGRQSLWHDDYWPLLIQLYLRKPVGIKPLYSRAVIDLAIELHIHPQYLYRMMQKLEEIEGFEGSKDLRGLRVLSGLMERYARNPRKLAKKVEKLRGMSGFGSADIFYEGVEVNESFEKDFRPLDDSTVLTPVMLVMVLDLYFRLTPQTMVTDTPEVIELAKVMQIDASDVVAALAAFRNCDPCLAHKQKIPTQLDAHCLRIWQVHANEGQEKLSALAQQLKEYFS